MQRIPQSVIEDVRQATNIVDVVGQSVQLKKSGKNYFGLCPFHEEKSPSFSVDEGKQIFYCFGCGKGGNVFRFVEELEGLTFPEAVVRVADLSHISLPKEYSQGATEATGDDQRLLYQLQQQAADLYQHVLINTEAGSQALAYLTERGVTETQLKTFQLGYAPQERVLLKQIFKNAGYADDLLMKTGLFSQRQDGEIVDRFTNRILFPILDKQGKMIGFSGRLLADSPDKFSPKYLNSPETELFNKRTVLFNFSRARAEARQTGELLLFEGFMDVIAADRAGIKNGIASMGTSLTQEQIHLIGRTVSQVVVCYDGDSAGVEATYRAVDLIKQHSTLSIAIVTFPDSLDPDEYIRKFGIEKFQHYIQANRATEMAFKLRYYRQGKNLNNEGQRLEYLERIITELAQLPSVIEREFYAKQLAEEFQLSVESILAEIQAAQQTYHQKRQTQQRRQARIASPIAASATQEFQKKKKSRVEKAEDLLLYRLMHERSLQVQLSQLSDFSFVHDEYQELYQHFLDFMLTRSTFQMADFLDYLQADYLKEKALELSLMTFSTESSEQEIQDCLVVLKTSQAEERLQALVTEQKEASRMGDQERLQALAIDIINIQKQLQNWR